MMRRTGAWLNDGGRPDRGQTSDTPNPLPIPQPPEPQPPGLGPEPWPPEPPPPEPKPPPPNPPILRAGWNGARHSAGACMQINPLVFE